MVATTIDHRSRLASGLVIWLLVVALVAVGATVPATASSGGESWQASAGEQQTITAENAESNNATRIDDGLRTATGTVSAVIRFDAVSRRQLAAARAGGTARSLLQSQASQAQAPLLRLANRVPGLTVERRFWLTNAVLVTVDTDRLALDRLAALDAVTTIHRNFRVRLGERESSATARPTASGSHSKLQQTPPSSQTTYGPAQISADDAWRRYETTGDGVRVAVLDTGIDTSHSDLSLENPQQRWAEFNDTGAPIESAPFDDHGHGTAVSGLVAGGAYNGRQYGIAPDVELYHARVLDPTGTYAQVVAGMEWAVERDADVITMSLGAPGFYEAFVEPVRNAEASGAVVVSAAGNQGPGISNTPANVYDTLAVGATNDSGGIWPYSGGEVLETEELLETPPADWPQEYVVPDLAAPGVEVLSAYPTTADGRDRYVRINGTSMAAPHVAGAIALVMSAADTRNATVVREALAAGARKPETTTESPDSRYGSGIVDVTAGIEAFDGRLVGTVTDATTGTPITETTIQLIAADGRTRTLETNATGGFDGALLQGEYRLSINATGYEPVVVSNVTITANETTTVEAALTGTAFINGTIRDSQARTPIPNATVTATGGASNYTATTAPDGTYSLGPIGAVDQSYALTATADGYNTTTVETVSVANDSTRHRDLALAGTGSVTGTVSSATEQRPLTNATVTVSAGGRTYVDAVENGTYTVTGVPATEEPYTVNAVAKAFATNSTAVTVTANGTEQSFVLSPLERYLGVTAVTAPGSVEANTSYTVRATVANLGTQPVNQTVVYSVDSDDSGNRTVTLDSGNRTTVTFTPTVETAGTVQQSVTTANESTTRPLTVEEPTTDADESDGGDQSGGDTAGAVGSTDSAGVAGSPPRPDARFTVSNTTVTPATGQPGESITITTTVHNTGFAGGTACLRVTIAGNTVDRARLTVPPDEKRTATSERTIDRAGQFDVAVVYGRDTAETRCEGTTVTAGTVELQTPNPPNAPNATNSTDQSEPEPTADEQEPARTDRTAAEQSGVQSSTKGLLDVRSEVSRAGLAAVLAALLSMLGLRSRRG